MALNLVWCGGGGDVRVPDKWTRHPKESAFVRDYA